MSSAPSENGAPHDPGDSFPEAGVVEREPRPDHAPDGRVPKPSLFNILGEGRAMYELAASYLAAPVLRQAPRGDAHPVLVLPGFLASDFSTRFLRRFLGEQGFSAHPWKLGRNFGPREGVEDAMEERMLELFHRHGRKVSLVGWSLGGIYARELARRAPGAVRSVISLGSPFTGDPRANHSWRVFEWASGMKLDEIPEERFEHLRRTPPVPTTSIYSKTDGVAAWQCCLERTGPQAENIQVEASHLGLGFNPVVLYAVADRLAQPEGQWQPFRRRGLRKLFYRRPHGHRRRGSSAAAGTNGTSA